MQRGANGVALPECLEIGEGSESEVGGVSKNLGLMRLTTTSIGDADILIGNFAQLLVAIRTQVHIEVTREAANAFEKHQVLINITLRFDSNLARGGAFHKLTGITT